MEDDADLITQSMTYYNSVCRAAPGYAGSANNLVSKLLTILLQAEISQEGQCGRQPVAIFAQSTLG